MYLFQNRWNIKTRLHGRRKTRNAEIAVFIKQVHFKHTLNDRFYYFMSKSKQLGYVTDKEGVVTGASLLNSSTSLQ